LFYLAGRCLGKVTSENLSNRLYRALKSRRRRGRNVEIRRLVFAGFPSPVERVENSTFGFWSFPRFPRGVISTAVFTLQFSEPSDAAGASSAALVPFSLELPFSFWAKNRSLLKKILRQDGPGTTISRSVDL
jgi:hypothetical protein